MNMRIFPVSSLSAALLLCAFIGEVAGRRLETKLLTQSNDPELEESLGTFARENFPHYDENTKVRLITFLSAEAPTSRRYGCYKVDDEEVVDSKKLIAIAAVDSNVDAGIPKDVVGPDGQQVYRMSSLSVLHSAPQDEQLAALHDLLEEIGNSVDGIGGVSVLFDEDESKKNYGNKKRLEALHSRLPPQSGVMGPMLNALGWLLSPSTSTQVEPSIQFAHQLLLYRPTNESLPLASGTLKNKKSQDTPRGSGEGLRHYYIRRLDIAVSAVDCASGNAFFSEYLHDAQPLGNKAEVHALYYQGTGGHDSYIVSSMAAVHIADLASLARVSDAEIAKDPQWWADLRDNFEGRYHIVGLATRSDEQGKGAATALYTHFVPYLEKLPTLPIGTILGVWRRMVSAFDTYLRLGYRVFGRRERSLREEKTRQEEGFKFKSVRILAEPERSELEKKMCLEARAPSHKPPSISSPDALTTVYMQRRKFTPPTPEEDTCLLYAESIAEATRQGKKGRSKGSKGD